MRVNNQRGITSYLAVMFMALVATLVIAVIQSRLVTGIYRQRALSDTLKTSYGAESEIYDILAKVIYFPPQPSPAGQKILADGTILKFTTESLAAGGNRFIVIAERPFAINKIVAEQETASGGGVDKVEMILALDCTGSMGQKADPACTSGCISKMTAQKNAVEHFLQTINNMNMEDKNKIYTGLVVFGGGLDISDTMSNDGQWFSINGGTPLRQIATPTNDYTKLLSMLETGLKTRREDSPACCYSYSGFRNADCLLETRGTSVGSSYMFMNEYFKNNPVPVGETWKRFEITVTDGLPNSRNFSYSSPTQCPFTDLTPPPPPFCREPMAPPYEMYATSCARESESFLRCNLATQDTVVEEYSIPNFYGKREPENGAYGVVVYSGVPETVKNIFLKYAGEENKHYFETENANNLTSILENILGDIIETTLKVTIKREAP